jgi:diguanylate cyclase (GGDEF)-like protein
MMTVSTNNQSAKGEVAGSFLLGLVASFEYLNILPRDLQIEDLNPEQWYPYSMLVEILERIEKSMPYSEIIFFYAGVHFLRIWYENGPGKTMIHSGRDWLYANQESGGYNSVVRGGKKEDIGWCHLLSIDEEMGIAVYENVMPLSPDFVRGVFYGGCVLFDDMEYIDVESMAEQYAPNPLFYKSITTVRYRLKSEIGRQLDNRMGGLQLGETLKLNSAEIETLIWRNKGLQVKNRLEAEYHKAIGSLLENSITTIKQKAEKLVELNTEIEKLAFYDALTNLPNRRKLLEHLKYTITLNHRNKTQFALFMMDLDKFKAVNDSLGHAAGDDLLKQVAARMQLCLRESDLVARLGGDEFVVVLENTHNSKDVEHIAMNLISNLTIPFDLSVGKEVKIGASIGMSFYPRHGNTPEVLMDCADVALYQAKENGRGCFVHYAY